VVPVDLRDDHTAALLCDACNYDIGMTDLYHSCPECGHEVWKTCWEIALSANYFEFDFEWLSDEASESIERVSEKTGHPTMSVWFIQMAIENF